ncbi:MAG TPA: LysR family transcriptional regulator [Acidobacteriaceae bacterium]|jgi:DNA-binding transcriptional LysR family regulator|nr:LysR family transcriptional regulator [Acidobacteriaceae bacterium]
MEVRQLEIFRTLAGELNFTRTAERVNTVQSNVTAQIKSLEDELGTKLFDRLAKSVVLTDAGRRFLPYAERALCTMDEGLKVIKTRSEPWGVLRIGAPESILTYRLTEVLKRFQKKYLKVELQFRPYWDGSVIAELEAGRLDVAIVMTNTTEWPQVKSLKMGAERILLLAEPGHPLAVKKAVRPEDLAGQNLLLTEAGCSYRVMFDRVLTTANVKPANATEFSSVEAIKQCMMAGMGVGVLPEVVAARELKAGHLVALRWAGPELDIGTRVLWHKDKWMSPNIAAFLKTLRLTE